MSGYYQTFSVTGTANFPIDMLRYDTCFPRTQDDSLAMNEPDCNGDGGVVIWLARYVDRKDIQPTAARWQSFGWRVGNVRTEKR